MYSSIQCPLKQRERAGKTVQQVKVRAAKSDDLSSVLGTNIKVEGKN